MKISELVKVLELVKDKEGDINVIEVELGIITKFRFEIWTDVFENLFNKTFAVGIKSDLNGNHELDTKNIHLVDKNDSGIYLIDTTDESIYS